MLDSLCVTTSTEIAPPKNRTELAARIGWIVLICATLYVCYFSHLGAIGFVGPDEPRYAWIARDMAETGDWVTPRLYGEPWFEKPPLYYWGAAICFKLFGVSEAAARLPSAISALLATLAMAWLAWRIYGGETARWLLLLLPTTVGMIGFSHAAATDMPFSTMFTIAMVCVAVILLPLECGGLPPLSPGQPTATHSAKTLSTSTVTGRFAASTLRKSSWLPPLLFGFFLGLAVLAKGPAAIILCAGAVFFWALLTTRWRDAVRLFHPAAISAFCITALPWYILVAHRNPDFFRIFIIEHNFKRYLTPEFQHMQPFWFYLPVFLVGIFPWLFWIAGTFGVVRRNTMGREIILLYVCWVLFPFLFFSASQSKLPGYILPSIPPAIFLMAGAIVLWQRFSPKAAPIAAALTGLMFACQAALMLLSMKIAPSHSWPLELQVPWTQIASYIAATGVGGLLVIGLAAYRRVIESVLTTVAVTLLILLIAQNSLLPRIDPIVSPRLVAQKLRESNQRAIYTLGLQRGWRYGLSFYLHREVPDLPATISEPAVVVVSPKVFHNLEQQAVIERVDFNGWPRAEIVNVRPLPARPPRSGQPQ
jgi:4-amino-4-deoxy-L-arabinose transferase-like glycosyltransferase